MTKKGRYRLFEYMSEQHDVTLLESDMQEIENIVLKNQTEQCDIASVVCSVFSSDGSWKKFETSEFYGVELTKLNFDLVINWIKEERENYPDVFS